MDMVFTLIIITIFLFPAIYFRRRSIFYVALILSLISSTVYGPPIFTEASIDFAPGIAEKKCRLFKDIQIGTRGINGTNF